MRYIVLREPTTSGGYVNRFAFSDQRTTLAIDCGGASVSPAARITSMSEMANKLDISQAKGGLGQGVEWSASLADWDGVARTSSSIFDGSARFYGWSVAVARSDAETATPDWIFDVDHWMVTDVSADGGTISITVGERWANDGRLLAFGQDGATVPLVVGGHDVWVNTLTAKSSKTLTVGRPLSLNGGNPSSPTKLYAQKKNADGIGYLGPSTGGGGSAWFTLSGYEVPETPLSDRKAFFDSIMGAKAPFLCGKTSSIPIDKTRVFTSPNGDYTGVSIYGAEDFSQAWFFQKETDAAEVFIEDRQDSFIICAGGSDILGFGESLKLISGEKTTESGMLTVRPGFQDASGTRAYSRVPCRIGWVSGTATGGVLFSGDSAKIIANGKYAGEFAALDSSLNPVGQVDGLMFFKNSENATAGGVTLNIIIDGEEPSFQKYVSTITAKLVTKFNEVGGSYGGTALYSIPFGEKDKAWHEDRVPGVPREHIFFEDLSKLISAKEFTSINDINANGVWGGAVTSVIGQYTWMNFQILAINIYGIDSVSFGSDYALVRTSAYPFLYAGYSTNDRLDRAAITLIEQLAPYHGITISPAAPTLLPTAAQGGECLDASKTYRDNAIALLEETWQVLGVTAYGATPTDGQGLGEIPTPVSIVLGRFEDIVTEPVIEFCPVAGTLTKKAYIANVDQPFDATNPGKFYGGWGHSMPPDSFVLTTPSWAGTWTKTTPPPGEQPNSDSGAWYLRVYTGGTDTTWFDFPPTDYGYLLWKQCRAAYLVHKVKRGATYQFNGIYDESVVGQMWWESRRNGSRRIEWLCLQPRYLTYSVREAKPLAWSGSAVYIAGTLANYAGYDVSTWDNAGGDTLVVVDRTYDLLTGVGKYTVAIPPVPTVDAVAIYRDTLDAAHTIDRLVDTIDATAVTTKYTDTLEA